MTPTTPSAAQRDALTIWIVNQYAVPPTMAGPARHHLYASELTRLGNKVLVIASSFDHHGSRKDAFLSPGERWRVGTAEGVPFLWLRVPPYGGNSLARVWSMVQFGRHVRAGLGSQSLERPDVVVGSSPHLFGAWGAERLARRLRVPFVFEVRDLWPQSLVDLGGYAPGHPVVRLLARVERHLYQHASAVVSVLPNAIDHIVARGAARDRVRYLPNGVDLRVVPCPEAAEERRPFTFVYAGSHGIANALDTVLEAAKIVEDELGPDAVRFRFIGSGVERERLRARAEADGIRSVRFEEPVPRSDVFDVLAQADAFVVSSLAIPLYRHGVSFNKLFDYMAMARPIVAGLEAADNPVVAADAGLAVAPGDGRAMAGAVRTLLEMTREERRAMGLRGRRYAEEHHDVAMLARRLQSLLHEVAQGR